MTTKVLVVVEGLQSDRKVVAGLFDPVSGAAINEPVEIEQHSNKEFWIHDSADLVVKEVKIVKDGG